METPPWACALGQAFSLAPSRNGAIFKIDFQQIKDKSLKRKKKLRHEEEHKPELLSPDISGGIGVFLRERVGTKKFGMSLETREIKKCFGGMSRDFCQDILEIARKV